MQTGLPLNSLPLVDLPLKHMLCTVLSNAILMTNGNVHHLVSQGKQATHFPSTKRILNCARLFAYGPELHLYRLQFCMT